MSDLPQRYAASSAKHVLGSRLAKKIQVRSKGLKNGFSAIGLSKYILSDYAEGEQFTVADFVEEGYNIDSLRRVFDDMVLSKLAVKTSKGVYRVELNA